MPIYLALVLQPAYLSVSSVSSLNANILGFSLDTEQINDIDSALFKCQYTWL